MRRWFQMGLRAGVLAGLALAVVKGAQLRRTTATNRARVRGDDWPPVPAAPDNLPAAARIPDRPAEAPEPAAQAEQAAEKQSAEKAQRAPRRGKSAARRPAAAWVEPDGAACPAGYPVKAKLASGIFHLPGMRAYERTTPDRCYVSAEAAQADGLRPAKH